MPILGGHTKRKNLGYEEGKTPVSEIATIQREALEAIDNINEGQGDVLQAGVVASTDWSFTANINSATGALGSTGNTGGTAWLPDPVVSGALMRSVTSSATLSGIAPSLLPASGKYVSCAFELTPSAWGAGATVTAHSGAEKATEAEAIAAPPGTTVGKLQVRRVIIHNAAGIYSITAQEDVRPWATGGKVATETAAEGKIGAGAVGSGKIAAHAAGVALLSGTKYQKMTFEQAEPGAEHELSASRSAHVIFQAHTQETPESVELEVEVGGVALPRVCAGPASGSFSAACTVEFFLAPGEKYKARVATSGASGPFTGGSYRLL